MNARSFKSLKYLEFGWRNPTKAGRQQRSHSPMRLLSLPATLNARRMKLRENVTRIRSADGVERTKKRVTRRTSFTGIDHRSVRFIYFTQNSHCFGLEGGLRRFGANSHENAVLFSARSEAV